MHKINGFLFTKSKKTIQMQENLFARALNLEHPFYVKEINFDQEAKRLDILIDFKRGSVFLYNKGNTNESCKAFYTKEKQWRHLNFFEHECYLNVRVPRVKLPNGKVKLLSMPWEGQNSGFTLLFEALILQLCKAMPVNQVGKLINESDDKIWRMLDKYINTAREFEDFSDLVSIGVDETSKKKYHDYITLFVDLEKRKTIYITEGKSNKTVKEFVKDLKQHNGNTENIKDVSCDMSPAFIKGVRENLPNAEITFDKFHILKIINDAVDKVRREEAKEFDLLKNTRYIFLKNYNNLTKVQSQKLTELSMSKLNLKSLRALHIRENFQEIYNAVNKEDFEKLLKKWYFWATHSRLEPIKQAAYTIKRHWCGVLKWFESKINNGILEGLNSIIQACKAKARGYKTTKNFKIIAYLVTGDLKFEQINTNIK
ncbi:MAG: ISL3 family transposase [Desulfobacteraceae bacterium]|nr:ISL3 family transposase [Desulfobacteraceae bacterium]